MTADQSLLGLLHRATHRVPGVPAHSERTKAVHHGSPHRRRNHSSARPPRMMVAWQNRIAALFGQDPQ